MKPTAVSQFIDALFKMIFGLLFAKYSMSGLFNMYVETGAVFGIEAGGEREALSIIYPITSAAAMLGVTLGSIAAYFFAVIYTRLKYGCHTCGRMTPRQPITSCCPSAPLW